MKFSDILFQWLLEYAFYIYDKFNELWREKINYSTPDESHKPQLKICRFIIQSICCSMNPRKINKAEEFQK